MSIMNMNLGKVYGLNDSKDIIQYITLAFFLEQFLALANYYSFLTLYKYKIYLQYVHGIQELEQFSLVFILVAQREYKQSLLCCKCLSVHKAHQLQREKPTV